MCFLPSPDSSPLFAPKSSSLGSLLHLDRLLQNTSATTATTATANIDPTTTAATVAVFEEAVELEASAFEVGVRATTVGVDVAGASRQRSRSEVCYATLIVGARIFNTEL